MTIQTEQIGLRLKLELVNKLRGYCAEEGRSQTWVIDKALNQYLGISSEAKSLVSCKPAAKAVANKQIKVSHYSSTIHSGYLKEIERIRLKNCKTPKQAKLTQRIINTLEAEFNKSFAAGFTIDQILDEWETRGWQSFKADWMKPSGSKQVIQHESTRTRDQVIANQLTNTDWAD
tara:strand:- start:649 stop:1173 length:525 start_codon:yes stop_codon:yes gene_type:complete